MILTSTQLSTLKAWIVANRSSAYDQATVNELNTLASPDFTVFKTNVSMKRVGDNFVGTELAGLSSLNHTRLQTVVILSTTGVNPSLSDRRAFFNDIFSGAGGVNTRAQLLTLWKRLATVGEKLFATGTGSDASPATMSSRIINDDLVYTEGLITLQNVVDAASAA